MQWSCNAPIHEIHIVLIKKTGLRLIEETELEKSMKLCGRCRLLNVDQMQAYRFRHECRRCAVVRQLRNRIITGACTMRFYWSINRTLTRYEKQLNWLVVPGIIDDTLLWNYLLTTTYQRALGRLLCLRCGSILFFGPFCRRA